MSLPTFRIDRGAVHLFTHKAGLLARAAHDLRLSVRRFEITSTGESLEAWFDPASIVVDGVVTGGGVDLHSPSPADRRTIESTLREEILSTPVHSLVRYAGRLAGSGSRLTVEGTLSLKGRVEPVPVEVTAESGELFARVAIAPSRWGIPPYKALLGAIHLRDRVDIVLRVPDPR
jgi:hypothetical protein